MELVELEPGDPRFESDALPVLRELREHLSASLAASIYQEGYRQGLRYTAVYLDDRCVAVAGWRIVAAMVATRKLYVDDLVTTEASRSHGVGRFLLAALVEKAAQAGCAVLDLDSGVQRIDAHRFYEREGLTKTSVHFARLIDPQDRSS
jgi:GNAT superfamily N-acetyltransferase